MAEYIEREASCKDCVCYDMCFVVCKNGDGRILKNSPCKYFKNKADVVEVVRCKNCKFAGKAGANKIKYALPIYRAQIESEIKAEAIKEFGKFCIDRSKDGVISASDMPDLVKEWWVMADG